MKMERLQPLPAKSFVFPIIRPMVTTAICIKEMAKDGKPPKALRRECLANVAYMAEAFRALVSKAGLEGPQSEELAEKITSAEIWKGERPSIGAFNEMISELARFCSEHKSDLQKVSRDEPGFFKDLYQEHVLKRKVLLIHGPGPEDSPEGVAKCLRDGGYYQVDVVALDSISPHEIPPAERGYHLVSILSSDSDTVNDILRQDNRHGVSILMGDLGREADAVDTGLTRAVHRARKEGIDFVGRPLSTMHLLPTFESRYVGQVADLGREIEREEKEIEERDFQLMVGMERTYLYAKLVMESAWEKSLGHQLEKALV